MNTIRRADHARHSHSDAPDTAAEFKQLATLPTGAEREVLLQRLAELWLPMARRLAGKYRNKGETREDLDQVAALGLIKAIHRFDPGFGSAFESYAIPTVVGEIRRHFRDHTWDVHVPRRVQEKRNKVRASIRELNPSDDVTPTVLQIAEHSGLPEEDVLAGMEALESFSSLSLDVEISDADDGYSLADTLGQTEPGYDTVLAKESAKPCLRSLPERERRVLYLRFFRDMTQSRIAEELGISQMHVSRLLSRSCAKVREQVESDPLPAAA